MSAAPSRGTTRAASVRCCAPRTSARAAQSMNDSPLRSTTTSLPLRSARSRACASAGRLNRSSSPPSVTRTRPASSSSTWSSSGPGGVPYRAPVGGEGAGARPERGSGTAGGTDLKGIKAIPQPGRFTPIRADDWRCDCGSATVQPMPMRATTVRFSDDLWALLEREAGAQGVSAAQFIRDATTLRVAILGGRRGDPEARLTIEQVAAGALRPGGRERARVLPALRDRHLLQAVRATGLLDEPPDPALDRLAALAAKVLNAPVALVSVVDADRQFFAGCLGLPEPYASTRETPLSHSFCQYTVATREPLVVTDAREDPALRDNLAVPELGVVAYAGVPLITRDGHALGALCVIDQRPRTWSSDQIAMLGDLAASVVSEIELASARRAA